MVTGQLERGKKWKGVIAKEKFEERDVSWFYEQESIVNDIKAYEESLKTEEKQSKSKGKK